MQPSCRLALLCSLLALPPLAAQTQVTWLEGPSPSQLGLLTIDERAPSGPPVQLLASVELLPIELTLRTVQSDLRADRPRVASHQGFARIELPGNGRLLHYRRLGGARYGYLWVDAAGRPTVVLELPGQGVQSSPFADRCAVAPDGKHAALLAADGETLWLVRLDGQPWPSTGTAARVALAGEEVEPRSVCVGTTHLFCTAEGHEVYRCGLADGAAPEEVTPPMVDGDVLAPELAMSGDGSTVVTLVGPPRMWSAWLVRGQGQAVRLAAPPANWKVPGYLPEVAAGPQLLLDDSGGFLLLIDGDASMGMEDELYLLDVASALPPLHITADQSFDPCIGIGIMPAFAGSSLLIALGDTDNTDTFDCFSISTTAGIVNLTRTGTIQVPPYGHGTLAPAAVRQMASGQLLLADAATAGPALWAIDPGQARGWVVAGAPRGAPQLGRGQGPDVLVVDALGDQILSPALTPVLAGPAGLWLSADTQQAGVTALAATLPSGPGAAVLLLPDGSLAVLPPDPALRQVLLTPVPALVVDGSRLTWHAPGRDVELSGPAAVRVVVS